ncbi:p-hydroxybenzoic acid efflux pump subunit AaeA [Methylobacillus rhizosphaerae]|uniref:p-hydroxybenzoic acid efflux pump subunit AaeA n=1 Tax=Methylobacillus rhizosphaerae TaxID=551994 RepID=A0A238ZC46_9PROT|nr:efflux RND transporter periplasmic adaptor subunit [Methylobacillus rhizosphaerae]SNR80511.1 p-hydroxybenzoic acid efflux pump subunit AaeA [Methylobacillus rhizosphaerae]
MKDLYKHILRISLTLMIVAVAIILGHMLWVRYMDSPWTRDGRVRADVVNIASDVSGLVTEVVVRDNQFVKKGDLLFRIDAERYHHSLEEAEARLQQRKITLALKRGQSTRRAMLDDQVISREDREDSDLVTLAAKADLDQALAERDHAKLNLQRTEVRAPVDGWVSNLLVRPGDYAQAGAAKLALIDQKSYWVYGYFEEHKLHLIHLNDPVEIRLLGTDIVLKGHVESIARGITDRDNPTDVRLLANVNPSFNWVRLAQRVPVRVHIDEIPAGVELVAGMTCSVIVHPAS